MPIFSQNVPRKTPDGDGDGRDGWDFQCANHTWLAQLASLEFHESQRPQRQRPQSPVLGGPTGSQPATHVLMAAQTPVEGSILDMERPQGWVEIEVQLE